MTEDHHSVEATSTGLSDGWADAIAATAVLSIVIATVVYWLGGFPS